MWQGEEEFSEWREAMVVRQLRGRGIKDERLLSVMGTIPREQFVSEQMWKQAYADGPLPIGNDQTISQPYVVAAMTEALGLNPGDRVLEIGTGSGYQTAVLVEYGFEVFTVERIPELFELARGRLAKLGYESVSCHLGDGYEGWKEYAPFDGIIVTAAAPEIPTRLLQQLDLKGRIVIPVGTWSQELRIIQKTEDGSLQERVLFPVRFVPLVRGET
jgi:protein-L-isoaspartate(D-aspartate) O-methyltransferase